MTSRAIVLNWRPSRAGLLLALERRMCWAKRNASLPKNNSQSSESSYLFEITAIGSRVKQVSIDQLGLSNETKIDLVEKRLGSLSFEQALAFFKDEVSVTKADAVIVLPDLESPEPDAYALLLVKAVCEVCAEQLPRIVLEVMDPESRAAVKRLEGVSIQVRTPGILTAAFLAQGSISASIFEVLRKLLKGTVYVTRHVFRKKKDYLDLEYRKVSSDIGSRQGQVAIGVLYGDGQTRLAPSSKYKLREGEQLVLLKLAGEEE